MLHLTSPRQIFGIDLRSLALFRVAIGSILIIDLLVRLSDLRAHYTDLGVLPRNVLIENTFSSWQFSLHLMNGSFNGQMLLFALQLVFAFLLLVGYRTRVATMVSWILLVSLHSLNPMVLIGADDVLRVTMFWAMFLPLGARFSVDRALSTNTEPIPNTHVSAGTIALLSQVSVIYLFSFLYKLHPVWIGEYSALYYMFNIDIFANEFANLLLNFSTVLKFMTATFVWLELASAVVVWSPFFTTHVRLFIILGIFSMHIGIASTMGLGIFPFVSIAAILVFLPGTAWDWLFERLRTSPRTAIRIYFDGGCDFCRKAMGLLCTFALMPGTRTTPADEDPEILRIVEAENSWVVVNHNEIIYLRFEAFIYIIRQSPIFFPMAWLMSIPPAPTIGDILYRAVASHRTGLSSLLNIFPWRPFSVNIPQWQQFLVGLLLTYMIIYNVSLYYHSDQNATKNTGWVTQFHDFAAIGLYQQWKLFAPYPMKDDGWYVIPGKLADGQVVDLWRGGSPVNWDKPSQVRHDYKNNRWVKYMRNIWMAKNAYLRVYFGRYLCRDWNAERLGTTEELRTFSIIYMMEETLPDYAKSEVERFNLWNHDCFAKGPS